MWAIAGAGEGRRIEITRCDALSPKTSSIAGRSLWTRWVMQLVDRPRYDDVRKHQSDVTSLAQYHQCLIGDAGLESGGTAVSEDVGCRKPNQRALSAIRATGAWGAAS